VERPYKSWETGIWGEKTLIEIRPVRFLASLATPGKINFPPEVIASIAPLSSRRVLAETPFRESRVDPSRGVGDGGTRGGDWFCSGFPGSVAKTRRLVASNNNRDRLVKADSLFINRDYIGISSGNLEHPEHPPTRERALRG